ncbi:MAG: hypothetical protein ACLVL7_11100 [Anaerotruncus massiliensis (ex Togo et al. 2019)]
MVSVGGRYGVAVGTPNHMIGLPSFWRCYQAFHQRRLLRAGARLEQGHQLFEARVLHHPQLPQLWAGIFPTAPRAFARAAARLAGRCWVFEGVMKIVEGWMQTPHSPLLQRRDRLLQQDPLPRARAT